MTILVNAESATWAGVSSMKAKRRHYYADKMANVTVTAKGERGWIPKQVMPKGCHEIQDELAPEEVKGPNRNAAGKVPRVVIL